MPNILDTPRLDIYCRLFELRNFDFITIINGLKHEKQELALKCLTGNDYKEIGYGGAAGGAKSWTGCAWLAFMCLTYPGTRWFIGREELKRLRESTLMTWFKVCSKYQIKQGVDFKYNGQDHFIQFSNGSRIDLLELKELPSDPLFERYGSIEYTGGWIEEMGEISEMAYDTLKSRCGRQLNDKYGIKPIVYGTFNPKKNFVYKYFYKRHKEGKLPDHIIFIKALLYDNPHRESGYEQQLKDLNNKAQKERLLNGNFEYDDDPAALCDYEKILEMFTNNFDHLKGEKFITADIARFGSDKIRIGLWEGWRVKCFSYEKQPTTTTAQYIEKIRKENNVPLGNVVADEDGVGGGVVDILKCKGFINNSRALPNPKESDPKKIDLPENYENLQAQCAFKLAERINENGIYFDCPNSTDQEIVVEELEQLKQKNVDSDGKKGIIGKEAVKSVIGRSPDYRDMLLMRMWFEFKGNKSAGKFDYKFG